MEPRPAIPAAGPRDLILDRDIDPDPDPDLDLDRALRDVEDAERRALLAAGGGPGCGGPSGVDLEAGPAESGDPPGGAERAEGADQLNQLAAFRAAVVNSRTWRLAQFLRGLVGRRW